MRKLIVFSLLCAAPIARAAVPSSLSVEGVLRDSSGKLQSMMVAVSVALYDAQTNGNKLAGPYGPTMVMAQNGLFSVPISDASLQTELAGAAQLWLEVTVGSDTFARQPVESQLFALMCGTADVAKRLPDVSDVGGKVGIGTDTPAVTLDVNGAANASLGLFAQGQMPTLTSGKGVIVDGVGGAYGRVQAWDFGPFSPLPLALNQQGGNVGIGTTTPATVLEVAGPAAPGVDPGLLQIRNSAGNAANNIAEIRFALSNTPSDVNAYISATNTGGGNRASALAFATWDGSALAPRMTIASGGNVGIGTISPTGKLTVTNGDDARVKVYSNGGNVGVIDAVANSNDTVGRWLSLNPTGANVGIGMTNPSYALDVNGTIRGTNVSPSDARLKTNVRTIEHALDDVERLRGVRFDWKKDGTHSIGLIAQEVESVFPEVVSTADYKAVDYGKLVAVLIEASKELHEHTRALERENAALTARLAGIEAQLDRQAAR
jgi:hypothetical protein